MSLTKAKLASLLQTQLRLEKKESLQLLETLLNIMKDTLTKGDGLLVSGFGKFSVRQKKARRGRNPQTKGVITLQPRKVMVFKASGVLRRRLNKE
jgi:integration host factor subunit alpha